jgi:hypothetical protein
MAKSSKSNSASLKKPRRCPDDLVKTGRDSSKVELTQDELSKVTGGKHIANVKWS